MKQKKQKSGFISILLCILFARLVGNLLSGKLRIRAGDGEIKAGQNF